jgi:hypothetical protein
VEGSATGTSVNAASAVNVVNERLDGSSFNASPKDYAIFRRIASRAAKRENRRLPRLTHRDALPGGSVRKGESIFTTYKVAQRWVVPGSRLLPHVSAAQMIETTRRGLAARAKAAPLQPLPAFTLVVRRFRALERAGEDDFLG